MTYAIEQFRPSLGRSGVRTYDLRGRGRARAATAPSFSGTAYVGGIKTTGLNSDSTLPWVKCVRSDNSASEQLGPAPSPLPADEEWYEKAYTFGDIHVPGMG